MPVADLDLELDVFAGPFDLLMAVVLREGVNLAEVELGEVVVAYVEHLEEEGELDLESATEFLVLIAALLELKSRLLLPVDEEAEDLLAPEEAADELLARMLEYRRYHDAAGYLQTLFEAERDTYFRRAPLPPEFRRVSLDAARPVYVGLRLAEAIGGLLRMPEAPDTSHIRPTVSLERRLAAVRQLLKSRSAFDFDEAFGREDKLTQAVTIFALLEMHKRGEATWDQSEIFGPIQIKPLDGAAANEEEEVA
ncbi:MAG: segregation and condensation protein [Solirubrobacterales bacterium]|nr:segregation and condensation protein [Solirubrobacterales bacterium]